MTQSTWSSDRGCKAFLRDYPDIGVELIVDNGFTNIVERQFDAGVRLGEAIARDMVAVRVGADVRYAVVGSPDYFAQRSAPRTPQELTRPQLHQPAASDVRRIYAWEFKKDTREFTVRVGGQLTLSHIGPALDAALDDVGLAYAPGELARPYLDSGQLQEVLADWCPTFQGYHLYYPSRRHPSPAFTAFVDAFRFRSR